MKVRPIKKIALIDLREGMVIIDFKHHLPSLCTKTLRLPTGDIGFRIENNDGSFWGSGDPSSDIDASTVRTFLGRLVE